MKRLFVSFLTIGLLVVGYSSIILAQDTLVLRGQVYVANYGTPLSDVQLEVRANGKLLGQKKTDQQGNFTFSGLPPGTYQLEAQLAGFQKGSTTFTIESGKVLNLDLGLKIGHWVHFSIIAPDGKDLQDVNPSLIGGVVKRTDGKPISDATVVLVSLFSNDKPVEVQTNAKGEFSFHAVEGQFVIYVYKRGYKAQSDTMILTHPSYGFAKNFTLKTMDER